MKNRLIFIALMTAFLGSWAAADERSSLAAARGRFEKGDFEYSRLLLEDFIQEYPLSLFIEEARLLKALSEYQIGEASSALQSLEMIPLNSLNSESRNSVLYWMGRIHLERGDTESALEDLLAADQQWNTQEQASSYSLLLGRAYIQSENYPQSISFLESYLEEYQPGDSPANSEDNRFQGPEEAVNLLIYALIQEGEWDRVVDLLDQRELSPAQNLYMAEALLGMGDFLRAKSYYESLMNADLSLSVVAYQRLFNAALESGNLAEAQRIITEAELNLAKEPDILMDFWRRIGVGAYRQGDLQNAENYLTKIWFRRQNSIPQEVSVYYLARLYSETLRSKEALDLLKEYAALGGELSSDALSLQAKLYLDSGNFSQAQSIYLGLLTESPQDSSAGLWTYLLAWLSSQQGDSALAISYLQNSSSLTEAHELYAPSLKLLAQEQKKLGNWEVADEAYSRYLSLNPSDPWANSEYLSVYFVQERFALLVGQAQKNKEYLSAWKTAAPRAYFSHQYQYGLALVSLGRYAEAAEILASLETLAAVEEKLLPYGRFYRALAIFRQDGSRWTEARMIWDQIIRDYPDHTLVAQSLFWSGWMSLRGSDFDRAESAFRRHSIHPRASDRSGSRYYLAKALLGQGQGEEALRTLDEIAKSTPPSSWSPNAIFDRAEIFETQENWDLALREYRSLNQRFPQSPLAPEALLQAGQLLINLERWGEAKEAYKQFRQSFPQSEFSDMTYFQQALASKNAGEDFEAILILTDLIDRYPDSNYRGSALWEVAGLYEGQKNFQVARDYYKDLAETFSGLAQTLGVEQKLQTIDLLIEGYTEEEARLQVEVALGNRASTAEGRQAMVELSRLYIFGQGDRLDVAKGLLEEVLTSSEEDRVLLPRAQYLLGEYWFRQGELLKAGNAFYAAVQMRPADQDLSAQALLRAAEMIYLAGNLSQARTLITALVQNFPGSIWAQQGSELLEEMR